MRVIVTDCSPDTKKLGLTLTPVETAFEESISRFMENSYVKNRR